MRVLRVRRLWNSTFSIWFQLIWGIAIADDPAYVKAILRRAQANEKIDSWAALSKAQDG